MTEPPRPPGDNGPGTPQDPTAPPPPPASYTMPGEATTGYSPPPGPPPSSPPPGSYAPPPTSGQPYSPPPPPPGAYGPPGGYQTGPAPAGYPTADDKTWALIAHFGGALGMFVSGGVLGFVAPLIAYSVKGQQSPTVRAHAVAALNFQLLWSIIGVVAYLIGCFAAFIPTFIVMAIGIIFGIIAGVKANEGELYKYPMSASFVK